MPSNEEDFESNPPPIFLTKVDRQVLAQSDEEFHYQTWEDLEQIICKSALFLLYERSTEDNHFILQQKTALKP